MSLDRGALARALLRACHAIVLAAVVLSAARCGGGPTTPPPPSIPALTISCPSVTQVQSMDNNPVTVTYAPPTAGGGVAPLTTTCTPASETAFNVGTTTVQCSTTDTRGVTAACNFAVTVLPPPRLVATRFVAFGDSLTAGVYADPVRRLTITVSPYAYPEQVLSMMRARYRQQSIDMVNEGIPGEWASDCGGCLSSGIKRFRNTITRHQPGIVLLMEGTNDLLDPDKERGMTNAIAALSSMIREAKSLNVRVALATIPPQRPDGTRNRGPVAAVIPTFNDRIRALAAAESVPLVDVFNAMKDDLSLIGDDDLHPTIRGFEVMAQTFFEAVQRNFEERPPAPGAIR